MYFILISFTGGYSVSYFCLFTSVDITIHTITGCLCLIWLLSYIPTALNGTKRKKQERGFILPSSFHRKLALTSLSAHVGRFWATSGEKLMCAINKSSGWGPAPAWLLVNGTLLWRQITHWLGFLWKAIQLESINIAVGNTTNHVILKR